MDSLAFSVSMCVYGGDNAAHFDTAVDSVVNQTVRPQEIVLTVDGPVPESIDRVIEKYSCALDGSRIAFKVIRLEKNVGHGEARRICFDNCAYDLIALMDADDISVADRFQKEIEVFKQDSSLSVVGSHVAEFTDNPEEIKSRRTVSLTDDEIKRDMRGRCPVNQPTVMFKKKDVAEVGGYIDWFCNEDYYLWIRLAQANKRFANVDECLVKMRVDQKSYQRRGGLKYFRSERNIQRLMLRSGMITPAVYLVNVAKRFIVQLLLPNSLRGWVFNKFARE